MNLKSKVKKSIAIVLCLVMVVSGATICTSARSITTDNGTVIEKISNPDTVQREVDGLIPGGDRETSYAWCMASRGDYVYIGTNKNIIDMVAGPMLNALQSQGLSEELVNALKNAVTNGEFPDITTTEGGYILRCNEKTGEIEKIYTLKKDISFRMAIEYNGDIYFGSYATTAGASNEILKVDKNDKVTSIFSSYEGTSYRAACIYNDNLYFGGLDASETLDKGYEKCQKLAILYKDKNDDTKWNKVADYKDFGIDYSSDDSMTSAVVSPVWDICTYKDDIIASLPNHGGMIMFKGHPAKNGEKANSYGWYWEEIIGSQNGINNVGLNETSPEGYTGAEEGILSIVGTPFVFNDKLYVSDFDHTIDSTYEAIVGILSKVAGKDVKLSTYLSPMYTTLNHPQSIWCLDNSTGKFEKVKSFSDYMKDNCIEYVWRSAVYNGELYISTMDSAVLYNYITKLTDGSFSNMTDSELKDQINYIEDLIKVLLKSKNNSSYSNVIGSLTTLESAYNDYQNLTFDSSKVSEFVDKYSSALDQLTNIVKQNSISNLNIVKKIKALLDKIDWDGIKMYCYISNTVKNDTWGFDLLKSSDGVNFELVCDNGFNDKYNYGGRSLLATENGLYIGTANPFYGAQLWRLTNDKAKEVVGDVNGDGKLNILDSTLVQKYLAGLAILSSQQLKIADVTKDGNVSINDSTLIQKVLADKAKF